MNIARNTGSTPSRHHPFFSLTGAPVFRIFWLLTFFLVVALPPENLLAMRADSLGRKQTHRSEYAFGFPRATQESAPNRVRFTGREWDADAGLTYLRGRWLDSATGRFLSQDPIGFAGGLNLYGYVQNNPINYNDPPGTGPVGAFLGALMLPHDLGQVGHSIGEYYGSNGLTGVRPTLSNLGKVALDLIAIVDPTDLVGGGGVLMRGGQLAIGATTVGSSVGTAAITLRGGVELMESRSGSRYRGEPQPPERDASGKFHTNEDELPGYVPNNWTREQLGQAAEELIASIKQREAMTAQLGEEARHRDRIERERKLLRQILKKLNGCE